MPQRWAGWQINEKTTCCSPVCLICGKSHPSCSPGADWPCSLLAALLGAPRSYREGEGLPPSTPSLACRTNDQPTRLPGSRAREPQAGRREPLPQRGNPGQQPRRAEALRQGSPAEEPTCPPQRYSLLPGPGRPHFPSPRSSSAPQHCSVPRRPCQAAHLSQVRRAGPSRPPTACLPACLRLCPVPPSRCRSWFRPCTRGCSAECHSSPLLILTQIRQKA